MSRVRGERGGESAPVCLFRPRGGTARARVAQSADGAAARRGGARAMEGSDAAALVRKRNPGRVPVICELDTTRSSVGGWVGRRAKFLVSDKLNVAQFRRFVRSNLVAQGEGTSGTKAPKVVLFLPDGLELSEDALGIAELDDRHRSADGFLYLQYATGRPGARAGSPRASGAEELDSSSSSSAAAADSALVGPAAGASVPADTAPGAGEAAPRAAIAAAGDPAASASSPQPRAAATAATASSPRAAAAAGAASSEAASPSASPSPSSAAAAVTAAATQVMTASAGGVDREEAAQATVAPAALPLPLLAQAPEPAPAPAPATPPREQPATMLDVDDLFKSPIYTASPVLVSAQPATASPVYGKEPAGSAAPKLHLETEAPAGAAEAAASVSSAAAARSGAVATTTGARTLTISERRPSPEWPKPAIYHSSSVQRQPSQHALDSVLDNGGFDSMVLSDESGGARESSSLSGWPALSRESTTEDGAFAGSRVVATTQLQSQWLDQPSPGRNAALSPGAPALLGTMQMHVHAQRQQQQQQHGGPKVGVILSQLTEQQQRLLYQHHVGVSGAPYAGALPPIVASPTAPNGGHSLSAASAQSGAAAASAVASQLQQQQLQMRQQTQQQELRGAQYVSGAGLDEWVEVDDSAVPATPGAGNSGALEKGRAFLLRKISQLPETKHLLPSVAFGKEYVTSKAASLRSLAANMIASGGDNAVGDEASGAAGARRNDQFALGESGSDEDDDSGLALARAPLPKVPGPQPPAFGAGDEDNEEDWTALDCDAHDESRYV